MKLALMTLIVAKVAFSSPAPEIKEVKAKFDEAGIEWNAIDKINWDSHTYKPEVAFRIMHSDTEIYLQYKVKENGVRATYGYDATSRPWTDDCVEFFVIPSNVDSSYFNLEINAVGHGIFNWGPNRQERYRGDDSVISQIRRESSLGSEPFGTIEGEQEWTITIAIPKKLYAVRDTNLADFSGRTIRANFYKCGDDTATPHYLSWNPIGTPKPQFHTPEYFGYLKFE
ncbi:MAG: hypothetical protein KBT00_05855 [Bacteroidales bacterium]|nr:hypothetical protein [Candidatus Cacconaster merdequi]